MPIFCAAIITLVTAFARDYGENGEGILENALIRSAPQRTNAVELNICMCVCVCWAQAWKVIGTERSERSWENDCPLSRGANPAGREPSLEMKRVGSPFYREGRTSLRELFGQVDFCFLRPRDWIRDCLFFLSFFLLREFALDPTRDTRL